MKVKLALGTTLGNGTGKIKFKPHSFGNGPVAVHGHIAEQRDGIVIEVQLLPGADQGTILEICLHIILVGADIMHIKGLYSQISHKNIPEIFAVIWIHALFPEILAVYAAGTFNGPANNALGVKPGLFHLIVNKPHPCRPVLNLGAVDLGKRVNRIYFILNFGHEILLMVTSTKISYLFMMIKVKKYKEN